MKIRWGWFLAPNIDVGLIVRTDDRRDRRKICSQAIHGSGFLRKLYKDEKIFCALPMEAQLACARFNFDRCTQNLLQIDHDWMQSIAPLLVITSGRA
jgi:hypothetical protein